MALSPVRLRASMSVGSADTIAFTRSNSPALIASMKAALLEVVSGMPRFYRAAAAAGLTAAAKASAVHRPRVAQTFRSAVWAAIVVLGAAEARAQTPPVIEYPLLGSTFSADMLRDLPTAGNVFAVPETIQLETVSDLFSAGGLNVAAAPHVGGL